MFGANAADALGTLLADGDHHVGEFEFDLQRFVPHIAVMRIAAHLPVTLRAPPVAAREQCHVVHLRHVGDHHFGHRGLARAADGDVADADDRNVEFLAFEDTPVEEAVTKRHPRFIEDSRRCEQEFQHLSNRFVQITFKGNDFSRDRQTQTGKSRPFPANSILNAADDTFFYYLYGIYEKF